jgi:DNA-binding NarL/FixJ family response regulator
MVHEPVITVSLVEDVAATRENLLKVLGRAPSLKCLGACSTGEKALEAIPKQPPNVLLADINLPGMSGIELVARLKVLLPKLQVLMLTTYEDADLIFESLRAGASGYLIKNMPPAELVQAIQQVHAGGAPMSMQIARKVVSFFQKAGGVSQPLEGLTKREQEILQLLAKGYLYKEIASHLGISSNTVRVHLHTIYEKLHVQSRTEAVVKFMGGSVPPTQGQ